MLVLIIKNDSYKFRIYAFGLLQNIQCEGLSE